MTGRPVAGGPGDRGSVVVGDEQALAESAAARLIVALIDAQAARGSAGLVLTGGRIAELVYRAVAASPAREAVDWGRVDLWWGDERFLPAGHPDRNETRARAALLDAVPVEAERVHPMPAAGAGADPHQAAQAYRQELHRAARWAGTGTDPAGGTPHAGTAATRLPRFDVVLLGVGEDCHVASLFPGHASLEDPGPVIAEPDSPKPPPVRLSLSLTAINSADQVWLIASGTRKARAVAAALGGLDAGDEPPPAARVRGRYRTLWLLDRPAATGLAA